MEENRRKRTKLIITAVAIVLIVTAIAVIIYLLGSSGRALKKQLDLGHKYLIEQEYEQAIVCFRKAIEIDPMCEDAYLSMADAYVGLDDFDNAMSLLEEAIKLFESNGLDATALQDKLVKIRAEKERIEEEKVAEDERKRIAELPYIEIQPILDCLDDLWGRKWTDWTYDDYVKEFNLEGMGKGDLDDFGPNRLLDYVHIAGVDEDGFRLSQNRTSKVEIDENSFGTHYNFNTNMYLSVKKDRISYWQCIKTDDNDASLIKDCLYNYANKNGIYSVETAMDFWGIEKDGEINTDLGLGTVACEKEKIRISVNEYEIEVMDCVTDSEDEYYIPTKYYTSIHVAVNKY